MVSRIDGSQTIKHINLPGALLLPLLAITPLVYGADASLNAKASPAPVAGVLILIADPRTEGVIQPMGVEEAAPRFSWRYVSPANAARGFQQSGYQVQVASSLDKLSRGQADMWDSGKVVSSDSLNILYAGKPLQSATRYYWQATGFDADKAYPAAPQFFETGLLKAGDWQGAQWISARTERPKTIPAMLQCMADYTFQTRFCIMEGYAILLFRAAYCSDKGYGLEIHPGNPGRLVLTSRPQEKNPEILSEVPLPNLAIRDWHTLQVEVKGSTFSVRIDDVLVRTESFPNAEFKTGTVALGAKMEKGKIALVNYDDFRLGLDGETLVKESFDDPTLFAFQECFFSNDSYSVVKSGTLEVKGLTTYLDPKDNLAAPLFRKTFAAEPKKIVSARAYVAGLGYYTFWLNGKRLDDYFFQPGFARYDKTAYYTVYDLTEHLAKNNALALELGRGWYGMTTPTLWGETFARDWMAEPALRVLVTIDYADGTRQTVTSDTSFKTAPGPTLVDSVKAGEIYDARMEVVGWNGIDFNDSAWKNAVVAVGKMPSALPGLTAQLFEPIRIVESVAPVSIEKIEDEENAWLIDFGKTMAGNVDIKVRGEAGKRIRMNYLERKVSASGRPRWNNFNAQSTGAFQTDVFIPKGGAEETFIPRYSYKGFRYLRVEGPTEKPTPDQFTAKVINSDMVQVGDFQSSSELWNKIWKAGRGSIQSNMHSIPTDCPTWEKLPWTSDSASPYYAMAFNYDLRKLYEKYLQDFADDISADGRIRNVVPGSWAKGDDPAWVGSYVNIAWKHYQTYGDVRVLERHFDNLKLYMTTLIKEGETGEKPPLLTKPRKALGDWVPPDGGNIPPEGALIYYNLYFYRYARMMADISKVLGRTGDATYYSTLAADLKKRFNEHHFDEKDGFYYSTNRQFGFRQSPQAIALAFGLVPPERIPGLVNLLVEDIQTKRDGHFWVGILGMEAVADALSENGRSDVAYTAHLKDSFPSLGNMIREGATTLWEDYSFKSARSQNHKMYATPLGWMARYVAGLSVDGILGDGPGFRHAMIAPHPVPEQITFAELDYDSPVGRYHSGWRMTDAGIAYDIVVPPNATATFRLPLPADQDATISESGKTLWQNEKPIGKAESIAPPVRENDRIVFNLGSGSYSFLVKNPNKAGAATSKL